MNNREEGFDPGFTIVELLVVIVVIAILASISIVAYTGIQNRAAVSRSVSELQSVNKAIQMYYAENGTYPDTSYVWQSSNGNPNDYVPGTVPDYASRLPISSFGTTGLTGSYMYRSNGTDDKLVAHSGKYSELCAYVDSSNPSLIDPIRDCWAYGYWSQGGSGY